MPNMICNAVKRVEQRDVAVDDQQMADLEELITEQMRRRRKINNRLRNLRKQRSIIIDRRHLTDTAV